MSMNFSTPHSRYNPLTHEWVLVSPHRSIRPQKKKKESILREEQADNEEDCPLCPGSSRDKGYQNPPYSETYSFIDDFSAMIPQSTGQKQKEDHLFKAHSERGFCKVLCYSPIHNLSMSMMKQSDILKVIKSWIEEWREMRELDFINHIQIFENRGETAERSKDHPHCQIWASESIPNIPLKEGKQQWLFYEEYEQCLLCAYLEAELKKNERIVFENENFVLLVPYWAARPYETILIPRKHAGSFETLSDREKRSFADALRETAVRYDNLFETEFPYSMGIHQEPVTSNDENYPHWHWHIHFSPPLSYSATDTEFTRGYELFASPQRDITPEDAAKRLNETSIIHYKADSHGTSA